MFCLAASASAAVSVRALRSARNGTAGTCRWSPRTPANLGSLLRTCDAVGACLAVPRFGWVDEAVARGNTLRRPGCVHRIADPCGWLADELAGFL